MKDPDETLDGIPVHDYGLALQNAVAWMGNRYLLAEPTPRRNDSRNFYFNQPRGWHERPRPQVQSRH
jgi:hypothetical protein